MPDCWGDSDPTELVSVLPDDEEDDEDTVEDMVAGEICSAGCTTTSGRIGLAVAVTMHLVSTDIDEDDDVADEDEHDVDDAAATSQLFSMSRCVRGFNSLLLSSSYASMLGSLPLQAWLHT